MGLTARLFRGMAQLMELGAEMADHPIRKVQYPSVALDGEQPIDEGPDDLWPPDDFVAARVCISPDLEGPTEPEVLVNGQWGLQLPNGEVSWNVWCGHSLDHPLDRVRLIANLQKTAEDIGLAPGEQTNNFLMQYGWVTRNQIASVVYESTGAYPLTHPDVSALGTPSAGETDESHDATSEAAGRDHHRGVHRGLVGGDAQ